jgi:hypothetical protein
VHSAARRGGRGLTGDEGGGMVGVRAGAMRGTWCGSQRVAGVGRLDDEHVPQTVTVAGEAPRWEEPARWRNGGARN